MSYTTIDAGYSGSKSGFTVGAGYTFIDTSNLINATGLLTSVSVILQNNDSFKIGTFYLSGGKFYCRDYETKSYTGNGSVQTFSNCSINCTSGDYLGIYSAQKVGVASGDGCYYYSADGFGGGNTYNSDVSLICFSATGVTSPDAPTNVSASDGTYTDKVGISWTNGNGGVTQYLERDGSAIYNGASTSYNDAGAAAPTITGGTAAASDGTSTSHVSLSISGQSANNGTTHTYRTYCSNAAGYSSYSSTNTGYRGVGSLSYLWYMSAGDSNSSYSSTGQTSSSLNYTGAPAAVITPGNAVASQAVYHNKVSLGLNSQSINAQARYFICYLQATGATAQWSSANRGYRAAGSLTYQWQISSGDADSDYSDIVGATTASYDYTTTDRSYRYYRCKMSATGSTTQYSAASRGWIKPASSKFIIYI